MPESGMRSEEISVAGKPGLSLRLVREEDWRALGEIMADFARSPFARFDVPKDTDAAALKSRISRWAAANRTGDEHLFFLSLFQGKPIGYISFNIRPRKGEKAYEIGYCFHSVAQGKGYAAESFRALFPLLEDTCGATLFLARTALENLPSVHLLAALSFLKVGEEQVSFYRDEAGRDLFFTGGIFERRKSAIKEIDWETVDREYERCLRINRKLDEEIRAERRKPAGIEDLSRRTEMVNRFVEEHHLDCRFLEPTDENEPKEK